MPASALTLKLESLIHTIQLIESLNGYGDVEVEVLMLNINYGKNKAL